MSFRTFMHRPGALLAAAGVGVTLVSAPALASSYEALPALVESRADAAKVSANAAVIQVADSVWDNRSRDYQLAPYSDRQAAAAARQEAGTAADVAKASLRDLKSNRVDANRAVAEAEYAARAAQDAAARASVVAEQTTDPSAKREAQAAQAAAASASNSLEQIRALAGS